MEETSSDFPCDVTEDSTVAADAVQDLSSNVCCWWRFVICMYMVESLYYSKI